MTEATGGVFHPPHVARPIADRGTYNRGIPLDPRYFEAKIVDVESRRELPPGDPGEIMVRGDAITPGYYIRLDDCDEVFEAGWFATGDVGFLDEDNNIYFLGRQDGMIKTGGENVFPSEIETVFSEWEAVSGSCVFGVEDERLGEKVVAVVEAYADQLTVDDVVEYLRSTVGLADFKRPREIVLVEELPTMETGKVDLQAARTLLLDGRS